MFSPRILARAAVAGAALATALGALAPASATTDPAIDAAADSAVATADATATSTSPDAPTAPATADPTPTADPSAAPTPTADPTATTTLPADTTDTTGATDSAPTTDADTTADTTTDAAPTTDATATPSALLAAPSVTPFADVPVSHPFSGEIAWLAASGITTGYPDGTFRGMESITRDAMAAFAYRLAGSPSWAATASSSLFRDILPGQPFFAEITWLSGTGVTTGYADGSYRPVASITRDAMAAFLYRLAGSPAFTAPATSPFTDVPTSHPFYREITWLASTGVTTGFPDGGFHPLESVSRDAMAAFFYRFDALGTGVLVTATQPATNVRCVLTGGACFQVTDGGLAFGTSAGSVHVVSGPIGTAWTTAGAERSPVGVPNGPQFCGLPNGGCYQSFTGGNIHWSPATGAHLTLAGTAIAARWASEGYERGALGYPTSDPICGLVNGGCYQSFQGGQIHWSPATGARVTWAGDEIAARWAWSGYEGGGLGYPTAEKVCISSPGTACYQYFQGGAVIWTPASGAQIAWGNFTQYGDMAWPSSRPASTSGLWDEENGHIDGEMCTLPWLTDTHRIHCRAVVDTIIMDDAYRARFGTHIPVEPATLTAYRPYDGQVLLYSIIGPPTAARPGTSPHGWGLAIDFDGWGYSTPGIIWLDTYGPAYGWTRMPYHDPGGWYGEWWHFDYIW